MDEDRLEQRKRLRRRRRQAAERLLDNSSLRDALTDDQGQRLLDWGLALADAAAARTAKLDDEAAEPRLEQQVTAVGDVMRQLNRLVELWPNADEEERGGHLKKLQMGLRALRGRALTEEQQAIVDRLAETGPAQEAAAPFDDLMRLLGEAARPAAAGDEAGAGHIAEGR